jgi:quercetin dioxygenase-like cupin family protein
MSARAGAALVLGIALLGAGPVHAQDPPGRIEDRVLLDNDSIRIVLLTYHPRADSDFHLNVGPEITIVQEGELALYTPTGREALRPGPVHWLPTLTVHLARNETDQPVRFLSLLLKPCE